jgi:radical SAM-linked protein
MSEQIKQRLRVTYTRDATLKYVGHLDTALTWQRILRRAGLPLAYSEGFNPQAKITFAAALPLGCTSDHEVMDVVLDRPCDLVEALSSLKRAVPPGVQVKSVEEVPLRAPALQAQLLSTEYVVPIEGANLIEVLIDRVQRMIEVTEVRRDRRGKSYNLRSLIQALSLERRDSDHALIRMKLQTSEQGNGRPDEVLAALELNSDEMKIHRTRLWFIETN